jgi:hypothetical protein
LAHASLRLLAALALMQTLVTRVMLLTQHGFVRTI